MSRIFVDAIRACLRAKVGPPGDGVRGEIGAAMVAAGGVGAGALPRRDGATLLQRVWGIDALACDRCGGCGCGGSR